MFHGVSQKITLVQVFGDSVEHVTYVHLMAK